MLYDLWPRINVIIYNINPVVEAESILPLYSMQVVKGYKKGWSEGSGKPLLCILSYEKTGTEREGRVKSP